MNIDELHEKFQEYGKNAQMWKRQCQLLLPEIDRHKVWKQKRFNSIYEYASKLAGLSQHAVDDALRIIRKIEEMPELMEVAKEFGLNRVRPVVSIATAENQKFLAARAREMSKHTLQTYVNAQHQKSRPGTKKILEVKIDEKLFEKYQSSKIEVDWEKIIKIHLKIEDKLQKLSPPPTINSYIHSPPKRIKKFILKRASLKSQIKRLYNDIKQSGILCEFPGCCNQYDEMHHVERFAKHHRHNPNKIYCLCKSHHNLAHQNLITNENLEIQHWKIQRTINFLYLQPELAGSTMPSNSP